MKRKVKHLRLDNSAVDSYMHCEQYWYNYYVLGLRSPGGDTSDAANLGVEIHKSLEDYYLNKPFSISPDSRVKPIFDYYVSRYPKEEDSFTVLEVERKIELKLEDWLTLVMRLDLIGKDTITNETIIIDHKTSSNLSYLNRKLHSNQFTCYLYGTRESGYQSSGGIINGICTKGEVYEKKSMEDKRLSRLYFSRTDYQIARWKENFLQVAKEMKDKLEGSTKFIPIMNDDCFKYKECYLLPKCNAENKELEEFASSGLRIDSWENFSVTYEE